MKIEDYIDEVDKARLLEPKVELKAAKELKKSLKSCPDMDKARLHYVRAYADTYICESYLRMGKVQTALNIGKSTIKYLIREKMDDLLILNYNMLGYICGCMDNYVGAATYFAAGIEIASRIDEQLYMLYILYINFAESYLKFDEYAKAKSTLHKSHKALKRLEAQNGRNAYDRSIYNVRMSHYYFGVGEYEKATKYVSSEAGADYILKARIAEKNEDMDAAEEYLKQYFAGNYAIDDFLEQYDLYKHIFDTVMYTGNSKYIEHVLGKLKESAVNCGLANFWVTYYENRIKASEKLGLEVNDEVFAEFYKYHQELSKQQEENERINLQIEMEIFNERRKQIELQKKNDRLKELSMLDTLTKTYNRNGLQVYTASMLEEAKRQKKELGYCIIDIDYFKTINDTYGHLMGDECLKNIARQLKKAFNSDAAVCRFGGDEFVIISLGRSCETLREALTDIINKKSLKNLIKRLLVKQGSALEAMPITLSIGAVNCIPGEENTDLDYLYTADKLLYQVKNESRNGLLLSDKLK